MDVVAFVPTQLLSHLRVVLRSGHTLVPVGSWPELHFVVQHRGADVVVADPAASGEMRVESLEELQRQFPSLPIVFYMQLSPASVKAIVRLAKSGVEHVVLSRFDDEPRRFLGVARTHSRSATRRSDVEGVGGTACRCLPVPVVRAVERLFRSPDAFQECSGSRDGSGDEPPHAVSKS